MLAFFKRLINSAKEDSDPEDSPAASRSPSKTRQSPVATPIELSDIEQLKEQLKELDLKNPAVKTKLCQALTQAINANNAPAVLVILTHCMANGFAILEHKSSAKRKAGKSLFDEDIYVPLDFLHLAYAKNAFSCVEILYQFGHRPLAKCLPNQVIASLLSKHQSYSLFLFYEAPLLSLGLTDVLGKTLHSTSLIHLNFKENDTEIEKARRVMTYTQQFLYYNYFYTHDKRAHPDVNRLREFYEQFWDEPVDNEQKQNQRFIFDKVGPWLLELSELCKDAAFQAEVTAFKKFFRDFVLADETALRIASRHRQIAEAERAVSPEIIRNICGRSSFSSDPEDAVSQGLFSIAKITAALTAAHELQQLHQSADLGNEAYILDTDFRRIRSATEVSVELPDPAQPTHARTTSMSLERVLLIQRRESRAASTSEHKSDGTDIADSETSASSTGSEDRSPKSTKSAEVLSKYLPVARVKKIHWLPVCRVQSTKPEVDENQKQTKSLT